MQFLLVWLLFPIVLTILLSIARPLFYPRYMIFCIPPLSDSCSQPDSAVCGAGGCWAWP